MPGELPMSKIAAAADFIEWDVRNWSAALDFWLAHTRQKLSQCSALELGSRNGGLSLWLALAGAKVICSDIVLPSSDAIQQHRDRGVSHLVKYESIDALNIPYTNEFDVVVFKSLMGALGGGDKESQATAMTQIHKALKKGGELFFAENLSASRLHRSLRRRFVRWGTTWRYVSVEEMRQFLSSFSHVDYRTLGFTGAFGQGEMQRNLFGILDRTILDRVVPENWRYIMVGIARK
jgi:SAM-dependent methyltransferase